MPDFQNQRSKLFRDSYQDIKPSTVSSFPNVDIRRIERQVGGFFLLHPPSHSAPCPSPPRLLHPAKSRCADHCPLCDLQPLHCHLKHRGQNALERQKGTLTQVLFAYHPAQHFLANRDSPGSPLPLTPRVQSSIIAF